MISFPLIVIFIVLMWIYFLGSRRKYYKLSYKLGGPWTLPIIGDLNAIYHQRLLEVIKKYREKYGSIFVTWVGIFPLLYVGNPVDAEIVLTSQGSIEKSSLYRAIDIVIGPSGLFSSKNPVWGQHRKILAPAYSMKKLMSYTPIFNEQTDILVHQILRKEALKDEFVDIKDHIMKCFLDVTMETTMGTKMGTQLGKNHEMLRSYQTMLVGVADLLFDVKYQNKLFYKFAPFRKSMEEAFAIERNFVKKIVEAKLNYADVNSNSPLCNYDGVVNKTAETFIDSAIKSYKEGKFSLQDVYTESTTVIIASFETVTHVVFRACMCLALYPKYQEELFKEIVSWYPDKNFSTNLEDMKNLPLLEMCFLESMRLFPGVPLVARRTSSDISVGDIVIPAGVEIAIDIMSIHNDPDIWGDDVKEFNPYRFLPENVEKRHPYSFLPFSKGPRQCMGIQYAHFVDKMLIAKIIRNYHLTIDMEYKDLKFVENIVLHFEKNPKFRLTPRKE